MVDLIQNKSEESKGQESAPQGVKVGDKVYTPQDVEQLITATTQVQEKLNAMSVVEETVAKYGIDAQTFVTNAEGAFSVMSKLIDEGIIDQKGEVVAKASPSGAPPVQNNQPPRSLTPPSIQPAINALGNIEALEAKIGKIEKLVESIDKTQASVIRTNLERDILLKHPELSKEDIPKVISVALKDRSKNIFDHAATLADIRQGEKVRMREELAKEFGIDLKTFDENKLIEADGKGGAGVLFKDKKFSFRKGKDENTVTPFQAAKRLFNMQS